MSHDISDNSSEKKSPAEVAMQELLRTAQRSSLSAEQAMEAFDTLMSRDVSVEQLETEWLALSNEDIARETETATGELLEEVMSLYAIMNFKMHVYRAVIEEKKRKQNNI